MEQEARQQHLATAIAANFEPNPATTNCQTDGNKVFDDYIRCATEHVSVINMLHMLSCGQGDRWEGAIMSLTTIPEAPRLIIFVVVCRANPAEPLWLELNK